MAPHLCYQGSNIQQQGSTHNAGVSQVLYHHSYFHGTGSVGALPRGWQICWDNAERIKTIHLILEGFWQSHGSAAANAAHYLRGGNKSRVCCLN